VAETQGNPLALLELPRGLTPAELAGGFGLPGAGPGAVSLSGRIEESFRRQLDALPAQTRRLLMLAAAEPYGDMSLVWRAAGRLGISVQAAMPAVEAGLVAFGTRVRFRHPLARSACSRSASLADRRAAHRALVEVTDAEAEPDRRAWHRAQATAGPDEEVAAELEQSADRAKARGGLAAAAAFLERSVLLTVDPVRRTDRTLAAAHANLEAGAFGTALELVAAGEAQGAGRLDELQSVKVDLLRGEIAFASGLGSDAPLLLLKAAKRLESLDLELSRETYLGAWGAALFAGRLAGAGDLLEVSRAARALPAHPRRPVDLLLDSLALLTTDGPAAAAPALRQAAAAFAGSQASIAEGLRWGWIAYGAASTMWDDDRWRAILLRQVGLARRVGALDHLPILLGALTMAAVWRGDFAGAAELIMEADAATEATGSQIAPYAPMLLASLQGRQDEAVPLIEATIAVAPARGQGAAATYAHWVAAILRNGLGHYEEALAAARQASEDRHLYVSAWVLPELIEAAARSGNTHMASDALDRLTETTRASGTDSGLGMQARSRALVSDGETAEGLYREAIDRLGRTELRLELARAHLLYGEWLRRQRRRTDAREQLRVAHNMLEAMGAKGFAERARRELRATGETARKRTAAATNEGLTAQETQIARLACDGLSNPEIATRLFISARTVQYHLGKIFAKLGITSRSQLSQVLP
jgi:DNA-binding CsgD family transcriptional regulator